MVIRVALPLFDENDPEKRERGSRPVVMCVDSGHQSSVTVGQFGQWPHPGAVAFTPELPAVDHEVVDPLNTVFRRGRGHRHPLSECFFQVKIDNVTAAGYDAIFIVNSETGDPPCKALIGMLAETEIPAYFVSRSVGYAILGIEGYDPANCPGGANPVLPAVGTAGETVTLSSQFDAWGYVHLIDAETLEDVDQFAIPEALDPAFAEGFGDVSVHEVAVDPQVRASPTCPTTLAGSSRSRSSAPQARRTIRTTHRPTRAHARSSRSARTSIPRGQLLGRRDVR